MKMVIKPIKRNDRKIKETTIIKIFLLNGTVNFPLYPQPCFGAFLEILTVKPVSYGYLYCGLEPDSKISQKRPIVGRRKSHHYESLVSIYPI